ncbi:hypothetical protein [Haloprofundus sp. MHR1]|uniref:hypothetical protein n=1 Tax=Haloprofundus sp. MHR1 TaxID=2572921 RepID=UPI0010BE7100|nr:hypothetical protein [Haloprofundus sp. MHR1]QCJ47231.1 hypothetical protein FCF25_08925 [Haloprofundus sp. MHR1]
MTEHTQTKLGIQNPHRSPKKVRLLSPEQLGIPSQEEEVEQDEETRWESLREGALEANGNALTGAAIRTEEGVVSTASPLKNGASQDIHALEFAVWKGYEETHSPITEVVVAAEDLEIPCGRCLQVLEDYALSTDVPVQVTDGDQIQEYVLNELLA